MNSYAFTSMHTNKSLSIFSPRQMNSRIDWLKRMPNISCLALAFFLTHSQFPISISKKGSQDQKRGPVSISRFYNHSSDKVQTNPTPHTHPNKPQSMVTSILMQSKGLTQALCEGLISYALLRHLARHRLQVVLSVQRHLEFQAGFSYNFNASVTMTIDNIGRTAVTHTWTVLPCTGAYDGNVKKMTFWDFDYSAILELITFQLLALFINLTL